MDFQAMTQRVAARYATETLDMVAAVSGDQLLGAKDFLNRKFHNPTVWPAAKRGVYFQLIKLQRVPLDLAERLADVGTSASSFPNGRVAWQAAKRYALPKPLATLAQAR